MYAEPIGELPNAMQAAMILMRTQQLVNRCHNFLLCLRRLGMGDDDLNVAVLRGPPPEYVMSRLV